MKKKFYESKSDDRFCNFGDFHWSFVAATLKPSTFKNFGLFQSGNGGAASRPRGPVRRRRPAGSAAGNVLSRKPEMDSCPDPKRQPELSRVSIRKIWRPRSSGADVIKLFTAVSFEFS